MRIRFETALCEVSDEEVPEGEKSGSKSVNLGVKFRDFLNREEGLLLLGLGGILSELSVSSLLKSRAVASLF